MSVFSITVSVVSDRSLLTIFPSFNSVSLGSFFGVGAAPGSGTVAVTLNDPVTVLEKQSDDNNKKNIINSNLIFYFLLNRTGVNRLEDRARPIESLSLPYSTNRFNIFSL